MSLTRIRAASSGAAFSFLAAVAVLLAGCAGPAAFGGSRAAVVDWAAQRGFAAATLRAGDFDLLSLTRAGRSTSLTIYIEGDGAAWHSPWQPPADPTPLHPIALAMAAADAAGSVAYLGRPCQYLDAVALKACAAGYWTQRRFAPEVVDAYMAAVDSLKAKVGSGDTPIRLVGHSGGGVIAALLALRRDDVESLITVAAPLALGEWTRRHGVSPLAGSLDPALAAGPVRAARAVHFVGERDKVVPPGVVETFIRTKGGRLVRMPEHDHDCCWARDWPRLLETLR